uniref:Ribonuclease H1 n=1 Tax=Eptatretus burgeri TaxID=7764 RepID=A0A8C4Q3X7_EPTBU
MWVLVSRTGSLLSRAVAGPRTRICTRSVTGTGSGAAPDAAVVVRPENECGSPCGLYSVRIGRRPGVYTSWEECRRQVEGFPGAVYKKFSSKSDADTFIESTSMTDETRALKDSNNSWPPHRNEDEADIETTLESERGSGLGEETASCTDDNLSGFSFFRVGGVPVVYTDGCCSHNGKDAARGGVGVFWGPEHPLNLSERLEGRQTNQRAEIVAACRAVEQAHKLGLTKLVVCTDSMHTVQGMGSWVDLWKAQGWRQSRGQLVVNKDDFQRLDQLCQGVHVTWVHVQGHSGQPGNVEADHLARRGAGVPTIQSAVGLGKKLTAGFVLPWPMIL